MGGEGIHNPADVDFDLAYLYLGYIYAEVAGLDGDAMRGTNNAALASACTEVRLAELGAANLPSDIDDILEDLVTIEQEIYEVEHHIHTHEKWMGVAESPNGEIHVADRMGTAIQPFALLSGDDEFGGWIQVMGSEDSPIQAGMTRMDAHRVLVTTTDSTEPFLVQFITGEVAGIGALLLAEDFTEFAYISATNNADAGITEIKSKRIASGTKVWARCICIDQANKTINIYVGIHEYVR